MKTNVLDSFALLAYFEHEPGAKIVAEKLQLAADNKLHLSMCIVNWGEVYYITLREYGEKLARAILHARKHMPIEMVNADEELTQTAAEFKARGAISYADCFAAALAKRTGAELVTGDTEFKQVEKEIKITWI